MEEGEPDADRNTLNDNPMTIKGEVLGPPFFYLDAERLGLCASPEGDR